MVGLNIPERVDGMGNLTDGELVARVRQGNQEAFSEQMCIRDRPYPVASRAFVQQRLRPGASGLGKAGNYPNSFGAFKQGE